VHYYDENSGVLQCLDVGMDKNIIKLLAYVVTVTFIILHLASILALAVKSWSRPHTSGLGLGLDLMALALGTSLRVWPRLTLLVVTNVYKRFCYFCVKNNVKL